jgi:hypothetical protein
MPAAPAPTTSTSTSTGPSACDGLVATNDIPPRQSLARRTCAARRQIRRTLPERKKQNQIGAAAGSRSIEVQRVRRPRRIPPVAAASPQIRVIEKIPAPLDPGCLHLIK